MKLPKNTKTSKKGFTLVELLVVIAIIAGLGALSYGPIMKFLEVADVKKTQKVCKDIIFAITTYEQEYDSLPYTGSDYPIADTRITTDTADFLDVLMGKNTIINDKGKNFFTADEAKNSRDGLVYDSGNVTKLLDKWGNPYHILLDYDDDGVVDATTISDPAATGDSYKAKLNIDNAIAASPCKDSIFNDVNDAKSW